MTDTTSTEDPSSESSEAAYGEAMGALFEPEVVVQGGDVVSTD